MNIIRNRLKTLIKQPYYRKEVMKQPPIPYIITEEELGDDDDSIGVNAICIDRVPFTGVWRI